MHNMPLVSIIVPCYNAEKWIDRGMTSILNQTFKDIEVIAVNDGSTDNTLRLLKNFQLKDSRVKVIDKENGGVSAARNCGIDNAQGRYIVFCDSDDFVADTYISDFLDYNADDSTLVIQIPSYYNEQNATIKDDGFKFKSGEFNISEGLSSSRILHNGYPFGKLFVTNIIKQNNLYFDESIEYKEDLIFILSYLQYASKIYLSPKRSYYYCIHPGSLSNKWKDPETVIDINSRISRLTISLGGTDEYLEEFERFCVGESLQLFYNAPSTYRLKLRTIKKLRESLVTRAYPFQTRFDKILEPLFRYKLYTSFHLLKIISNSILKHFYR